MVDRKNRCHTHHLSPIAHSPQPTYGTICAQLLLNNTVIIDFCMRKGASVKKIGIMVGREDTWPGGFIEEVNKRNAGVTAEFVKLSGTPMGEVSEYDVIIDRISHEIPYYRTYLKTAMLGGATIINNPFWWSADEKFFGASLMSRLGVAHPRTIALPSHSYIEGVVTESLRNLEYPIPWDKHVEAVGGFPLILKPHSGGGFKSVYKLHSMEDLWRAYNETGTECMMLQEFIEWEKYVRCVCVGREHVLITRFDVSAPWPDRYFPIEPGFLSDELRERITNGVLTICRALGYDMNTVEFAIKDDVPYAIDFTNPAPDFDYWSLKQEYFDWVVQHMADFCINVALNKPKGEPVPNWSNLLQPTQEVAAPKPKKKRAKKEVAVGE